MNHIRIIGGKLAGRKLTTPKGVDVRPTSAIMRKALFDICKHIIEDATVLDLFAGSGALTIEALSRGAQSVTCIDNNKESMRCIGQNVQRLGLQKQATLLFGNVFRIIKELDCRKHQYDIIFADPPYQARLKEGLSSVPYAQRLLEYLDSSALLARSGILFIESPSTLLLNQSHLTALSLVSSRRFGRSTLQQYAHL